MQNSNVILARDSDGYPQVYLTFENEELFFADVDSGQRMTLTLDEWHQVNEAVHGTAGKETALLMPAKLVYVLSFVVAYAREYAKEEAEDEVFSVFTKLRNERIDMIAEWSKQAIAALAAGSEQEDE